jgi:hypothetical protein
MPAVAAFRVVACLVVVAGLAALAADPPKKSAVALVIVFSHRDKTVRIARSATTRTR